MGESVKAICAVVLIVASIAAAVAWITDPSAITWLFRIRGPIVALVAVGTILKLHFRPDLAHDYLRQNTTNYFNRDGFCFAITATSEAGVCRLKAYFQNQYDQACRGRIAIRPARGFLLGRAKIETISFDIDCQPAAYGVASIAIPLAKELQGKRQSFEVGASVEYPQGKGTRLRFRDGIFLRSNSTFGNAFGTAVTLAGAATGQIVLSTPATATVVFPSNVAQDVPVNSKPKVQTLWKLGDASLDKVP